MSLMLKNILNSIIFKYLSQESRATKYYEVVKKKRQL